MAGVASRPVPEGPSLTLDFRGGTVCVSGLRSDGDRSLLPASARWDAREGVFRLPAIDYGPLALALHRAKVPYDDRARAFGEAHLAPLVQTSPFPYQTEAIAAWTRAGHRGVVVLPTGAGKTFVAVMAIAKRRRPTLVLVPTLDLLSQWYELFRATFGGTIGVIGGGDHDVRELTVTTYDSAHLHMEHLGRRFGLLVFDECHHLPSPSYAMAARMSLAPFRLGLTATPERTDGRGYDELIGPIVYRRDITELSGDYLAEYDTVRLEVELSPDERVAYEEARATYLDFVRSRGISMKDASGFGRFLLFSSQSDEGRHAFLAYRTQRAIALGAESKLATVERLLHQHRHERTIVFTESNRTAYLVSKRFLLPAITHQTKVKERAHLLAELASGGLSALVTSKVLNEGVNVPEASVAIVVSGSGSIREHVQRLGRVLRKRAGKQAVLYEIVSAKTAEESVSARRREHDAYR